MPRPTPTAKLQDNSHRTCQFELPIGWSASILVAFLSTSSTITFNFSNRPGVNAEFTGEGDKGLYTTEPLLVDWEDQFTIHVTQSQRPDRGIISRGHNHTFEFHQTLDIHGSPKAFYLYFGNNDSSRTSRVVVHVFKNLPTGPPNIL
ncbi:hypothetical protein M422DRAFT_264340 [Sphaerobolus stellatus SS14]|uniref:Uncharacterized protein n=1 Tax=Sphaerobolus stellatus (strain SS14) TaxID=990650 RepID=A0A0C9UWR4_SPHS4|nr:hypothetical protein M422DRAFT_264340 [Sphaerobolus stellatus SS14]